MQRTASDRLAALAVVQGLAIGGLATLIPAYLHKAGASDFLVGLSFTFWGLSRGVFGLIAGAAYRRLGHRVVLGAALFIFAVSTLAYALSRTPTTLVAFRLLQGVGAGLYWTSLLATVAKATPPAGRMAALVRTNILVAGMGLVGQPIAGALATAISPTAFCWISTVLLAGLAAPLAISLPGKIGADPPAHRASPSASPARLGRLQHAQAIGAALQNLPAVVTMIGMPVILSELGAGYTAIGVEGAAMLLASMLAQQIGHGWAKRYGRGRLLMVGAIVAAAALGGLALRASVGFSDACFIVLAATLGLSNLTWLHWAQQSVSDELLGPLTGVFRGTGDLFAVIGYTLFGVLAHHLLGGLGLLAAISLAVGAGALRLDRSVARPEGTGLAF